jgi:hypothetical protein
MSIVEQNFPEDYNIVRFSVSQNRKEAQGRKKGQKVKVVVTARLHVTMMSFGAIITRKQIMTNTSNSYCEAAAKNIKCT